MKNYIHVNGKKRLVRYDKKLGEYVIFNRQKIKVEH